jgi:branched-subunit amino acid ABC-type transport system permease component
VDKRAIGELRRLWAIGVLRAAPWPQRYAIAIGSGAAAGLVRLWIDPLAGGSAAFLFFAPAVLFTALLAGSGPGLVTTVFGAVAADYWFLPPRDSFKFSEPDDLFSMVLFALIGVLIVWLASERSRIGTERRLAEAEVAAANAGGVPAGPRIGARRRGDGGRPRSDRRHQLANRGALRVLARRAARPVRGGPAARCPARDA